MTISLNAQAVEHFRVLVGQRLGLRCDDAKLGELAEILHERLHAARLTRIGDYLDRLLVSQEESQALASRLTVAETYFFRIGEHFRAFVEVVLPDRMKANTGRLQFLSAGCATGEEAYTIAMLLREHIDWRRWHPGVRGVDINPDVIAKAKQARYSTWSLRETPGDFRQRYFKRDGKTLHLDDAVRAMVDFVQGNLMDGNSPFWQGPAYDAVFLRNVLMYLTPEAAQTVIANVANALAPGGYLFLAPAETLRGLSHDFHLCHTHDIFYYQLRNPRTRRPAPPPPAKLKRMAMPEASSSVLSAEASTAWYEDIQRASERIADLTKAPGKPPRAAPKRRLATSGTARTHSQMATALELFRQERYQEALAAMEPAADTAHEDPDMQLLRAVLQLNAADLKAAEKSCARLLAADDLNAGAHYVKALCCEQSGDREAAVEENETAIYLDPSFAMPRLHLGMLARKTGKLETAHRELAQAALLLAREESSRILLFGGGFSRESLVQLCQAELREANRGKRLHPWSPDRGEGA